MYLQLTPSEQKSLEEELDELVVSVKELSGILKVKFYLYYDAELKKLVVHLDNLMGLQIQDHADSSDGIYIEAYLFPHKEVQKSNFVFPTLSGSFVFDKVFNFVDMNTSDLRDQALVFKVYHSSVHFIGGILYPLVSANVYGGMTDAIITKCDFEKVIITYIIELATIHF